MHKHLACTSSCSGYRVFIHKGRTATCRALGVSAARQQVCGLSLVLERRQPYASSSDSAHNQHTVGESQTQSNLHILHSMLSISMPSQAKHELLRVSPWRTLSLCKCYHCSREGAALCVSPAHAQLQIERLCCAQTTTLCMVSPETVRCRPA